MSTTLHPYHVGDHVSEGPCPCLDAGLPRVTLGRELFDRARCRPDYSPDTYARGLAEFEGQAVPVVHRFAGPGGVYAYTLQLGARCYHVPARYVVEFEGQTVHVTRTRGGNACGAAGPGVPDVNFATCAECLLVAGGAS